ncbi:hypothetical protein FJZ26_00975 [Candidatus Parvarchaeota archaeon]|nr:hypothetical protein [Candidatus Parvarchaeota archaeon]
MPLSLADTPACTTCGQSFIELFNVFNTQTSSSTVSVHLSYINITYSFSLQSQDRGQDRSGSGTGFPSAGSGTGVPGPSGHPIKTQQNIRDVAGAQIYFSKDIQGSISPISSCYPVVTDSKGWATCTIQKSVYSGKCISVQADYKGTPDNKIKATSNHILVCDTDNQAITAIGPTISDAISSNMIACVPLFIIFGLFISSMYYSGKNPLSLFDITTPKLPKGKKAHMHKATVTTNVMHGIRINQKMEAKTLAALGQANARLGSLLSRMGASNRALVNKIINSKASAENKSLALRALATKNTRDIDAILAGTYKGNLFDQEYFKGDLLKRISDERLRGALANSNDLHAAKFGFTQAKESYMKAYGFDSLAGKIIDWDRRTFGKVPLVKNVISKPILLMAAAGSGANRSHHRLWGDVKHQFIIEALSRVGYKWKFPFIQHDKIRNLFKSKEQMHKEGIHGRFFHVVDVSKEVANNKKLSEKYDPIEASKRRFGDLKYALEARIVEAALLKLGANATLTKALEVMKNTPDGKINSVEFIKAIAKDGNLSTKDKNQLLAAAQKLSELDSKIRNIKSVEDMEAMQRAFSGKKGIVSQIEKATGMTTLVGKTLKEIMHGTLDNNGKPAGDANKNDLNLLLALSYNSRKDMKYKGKGISEEMQKGYEDAMAKLGLNKKGDFYGQLVQVLKKTLTNKEMQGSVFGVMMQDELIRQMKSNAGKPVPRDELINITANKVRDNLKADLGKVSDWTRGAALSGHGPTFQTYIGEIGKYPGSRVARLATVSKLEAMKVISIMDNLSDRIIGRTETLNQNLFKNFNRAHMMETGALKSYVETANRSGVDLKDPVQYKKFIEQGVTLKMTKEGLWMSTLDMKMIPYFKGMPAGEGDYVVNGIIYLKPKGGGESFRYNPNNSEHKKLLVQYQNDILSQKPGAIDKIEMKNANEVNRGVTSRIRNFFDSVIVGGTAGTAKNLQDAFAAQNNARLLIENYKKNYEAGLYFDEGGKLTGLRKDIAEGKARESTWKKMIHELESKKAAGELSDGDKTRLEEIKNKYQNYLSKQEEYKDVLKQVRQSDIAKDIRASSNIAKQHTIYYNIMEETMMRDPRFGSSSFGATQMERTGYHTGQFAYENPSMLFTHGLLPGDFTNKLMIKATMPFARIFGEYTRPFFSLMVGYPTVFDQAQHRRIAGIEAVRSLLTPWESFDLGNRFKTPRIRKLNEYRDESGFNLYQYSSDGIKRLKLPFTFQPLYSYDDEGVSRKIASKMHVREQFDYREGPWYTRPFEKGYYAESARSGNTIFTAGGSLRHFEMYKPYYQNINKMGPPGMFIRDFDTGDIGDRLAPRIATTLAHSDNPELRKAGSLYYKSERANLYRDMTTDIWKRDKTIEGLMAERSMEYNAYTYSGRFKPLAFALPILYPWFVAQDIKESFQNKKEQKQMERQSGGPITKYDFEGGEKPKGFFEKAKLKYLDYEVGSCPSCLKAKAIGDPCSHCVKSFRKAA